MVRKKLSKTKLDNKYRSISALLKAPNISSIIQNQNDMDWWENVASKLRNKSAQYTVKVICREGICTR